MGEAGNGLGKGENGDMGVERDTAGAGEGTGMRGERAGKAWGCRERSGHSGGRSPCPGVTGAPPQVEESVLTLGKFLNVVKLVAFSPFRSAQSALENMNAVSEGERGAGAPGPPFPAGTPGPP